MITALDRQIINFHNYLKLHNDDDNIFHIVQTPEDVRLENIKMPWTAHDIFTDQLLLADEIPIGFKECGEEVTEYHISRKNKYGEVMICIVPYFGGYDEHHPVNVHLRLHHYLYHAHANLSNHDCIIKGYRYMTHCFGACDLLGKDISELFTDHDMILQDEQLYCVQIYNDTNVAQHLGYPHLVEIIDVLQDYKMMMIIITFMKYIAFATHLLPNFFCMYSLFAISYYTEICRDYNLWVTYTLNQYYSIQAEPHFVHAPQFLKYRKLDVDRMAQIPYANVYNFMVPMESLIQEFEDSEESKNKKYDFYQTTFKELFDIILPADRSKLTLTHKAWQKLSKKERKTFNVHQLFFDLFEPLNEDVFGRCDYKMISEHIVRGGHMFNSFINDEFVSDEADYDENILDFKTHEEEDFEEEEERPISRSKRFSNAHHPRRPKMAKGTRTLRKESDSVPDTAPTQRIDQMLGLPPYSDTASAWTPEQHQRQLQAIKSQMMPMPTPAMNQSAPYGYDAMRPQYTTPVPPQMNADMMQQYMNAYQASQDAQMLPMQPTQSGGQNVPSPFFFR